MGYIVESLSDGEEVVTLFRVHWVSYLWPMFYSTLTLGMLLPFALYEIMSLRFMEQGLTNKRVIFKRGIISRRTDEMKLRSIETVEIEQGVFGRLLDYGTVVVTGRGISDVVLKNVDDPMLVKRRIESVSNPAD
ncbi:MAG: PH domain-containing protein [Gammaproteobacteria bacterium]